MGVLDTEGNVKTGTGGEATVEPTKQKLSGSDPDRVTATNTKPTFNETDQFETKAGGGGIDTALSGSVKGTVTSLGRITVTETDAGVDIDLENTKSRIHMNKTGGIFIFSNGGGGITIDANHSDVTLTAKDVLLSAAGNIKLDARGDVSLSSQGDLSLDARGSIAMTSQGLVQNINGRIDTTVTDHVNTIVGGHHRTTVAGELRLQGSANAQFDFGGTFAARIEGNTSIETAGDMSVVSDGDMKLHSDNFNQAAASDTRFSAGGTMKVDASSELDMRGGTINHNKAGADPETNDEASKAQVETANNIIDSFATRREFPEFPYNGLNMTDAEGSREMVSHDKWEAIEGVYEKYIKKNAGTSSSPSIASANFTLQDSDISGTVFDGSDITAKDPGVSTSDLNVPYYRNSNQSVAGGTVSIGEITAPASAHAFFYGPYAESSKVDMMKNLVYAATVILGPLRRQADLPKFIISSSYRPTSSSPNHSTGYTFDIQSHSKNASEAFALAQAAANLGVCKQVYLEKSGSGGTHVHVRAYPPGSSGTPKLLTCADPKCNSSVSGLSLEYLQVAAAPQHKA
jgi:hypothetical protein